MTPLQQAIKQTQEYASRFGGRLSKEELCQRLLSPRTYSPEEILLTAKRLGMTFYSEHSEWQTRKLDKAKRLADKLKSWPEILLIGVTGSVAAGYPDEEEDIDLLVITRRDQLWWTRLKLKRWLGQQQIPHRKYRDQEQPDAFCFNLWLDRKAILLPKQRQTRQNAVDLVMMIPVLNNNQTYEKFLQVNHWVKQYVATGYQEKTRFIATIKEEKEEKNVVTKIVNDVCYAGQRIYMGRRIGKGEVGIHKAYFYP